MLTYIVIANNTNNQQTAKMFGHDESISHENSIESKRIYK